LPEVLTQGPFGGTREREWRTWGGTTEGALRLGWVDSGKKGSKYSVVGFDVSLISKKNNKGGGEKEIGRNPFEHSNPIREQVTVADYNHYTTLRERVGYRPQVSSVSSTGNSKSFRVVWGNQKKSGLKSFIFVGLLVRGLRDVYKLGPVKKKFFVYCKSTHIT